MEPTFAIALSSGGARGAYEVGALKYLAERGLRFNAVAGASIGSLNGAFYVQGDGSLEHINALVELWMGLFDKGLVQVDASKAIAMLGSVASKQMPTFVHALNAIRSCNGGVLDPRPMERLIDSWIDYDRIINSPNKFIVAALEEIDPLVDISTYAWRKATYFRASECDRDTLRSLLLAATAIPFAFASRKVNDRHYSDAALVDALPAGELYRMGYRRIVSVFLSDMTIQNRSDFPEAIMMQIRPSVNIDKGISSCFDFSKSNIETLINLGYKDGENCFKEAEEIVSRLSKMRELGIIEEQLARSLPDRRKGRAN
jgi:NTE family protein